MITVLIRHAPSCSSRALILFVFGCILAVVLMSFQFEHKLLLFNSPRLMLTLPSLSLISICGLGAASVGLVYPMFVTSIDRTLTPTDNDDTVQKSQICKSLIIFIGINHLCAKITFPSDLHFSITVVCLCIVYWWSFDRKIINFIFSLIISFTLTISTEILIRVGILKYTNSDFYLKTCVPCLTFAGAILTIQITDFLSQSNTTSLKSNILTTREHIKNE